MTLLFHFFFEKIISFPVKNGVAPLIGTPLRQLKIGKLQTHTVPLRGSLVVRIAKTLSCAGAARLRIPRFRLKRRLRKARSDARDARSHSSRRLLPEHSQRGIPLKFKGNPPFFFIRDFSEIPKKNAFRPRLKYMEKNARVKVRVHPAPR